MFLPFIYIYSCSLLALIACNYDTLYEIASEGFLDRYCSTDYVLEYAYSLYSVFTPYIL